MACFLICGFELGSNLEAQSVNLSASSSIQTTTKRTGGYALKIGAVGDYVRFDSRATTTGAWAATGRADSWIRFYFRYKTKPSSGREWIFDVRDTSTNPKMFLGLNSDGTLSAYCFDGTSLIGTSASALSADTWYRLELKVGTGSDAECTVKVDGSTVISDTWDVGETNGAYYDFGSLVSVGGNSIEFYYDDIYGETATYPGAGQCEVMQVTGDGNYTTWTASTGDKWNCIDEIPYSNSDYVESTLTSDQAYTGALESAATAGISGTINCAEQIIGVKRSGSANGTIRMRLRSNTTDSDTGTNYGSTSTEVTLGRIFATDPATSAAWTTSGLDGVEVGALERETTDKTRMYGAYLMVDFTPSSVVNQTVTVPSIAVTTTQAVVPTVAASSLISAPSISITTTQAVVPSVAAGSNVSSPSMLVTAGGVVPTLTATVLITVPTMETTAGAVVPDVGVGAGVTAPSMTITASAIVPNLLAEAYVTIPSISTTTGGVVPVVSGGATIDVPSIDSITSQAISPSITASSNVSVPVMEVLTELGIPSISAGAQITAETMSALAGMSDPFVSAGAEIQAAVMEVVANMPAPVPTASAMVIVVVMSSTAGMGTPTISTASVFVIKFLELLQRITLFELQPRDKHDLEPRDVSFFADTRAIQLSLAPRVINLEVVEI